MHRALFHSFIFLASLSISLASAASPDELEQWQDWVLEEHTQHSCPWVLGGEPSRACIWPGKLSLALRNTGLAFTYEVEVFRKDALVPLPGAPGAWPMNLRVNGERASVVDRRGTPHAILEPGTHQISGQFNWNRRPTSLVVPKSIALVSLNDGKRERTPQRRDGKVVLGQERSSEKAKQRNALGVEVFRKLSDGIPMTLETRVVLTVSGQPREIEIGRLGWANTDVMAIQSPLPARIEDNGNLRAQLSPGRHTLVVTSRVLGAQQAFETQRNDEDWPEYEYLSFAANSALRQVKVNGASGIDTSQVPIPAEWKELPTWRLDGDTTLSIITEFRGDQSPAANSLSVNRNLWLDFDGSALTGVEAISGSMRREWRLNTQADTQLGSAQVSGQPVLVTQHHGSEGVEIRSPDIALRAVTRIDSPQRFSATGWESRADTFNATLHTPPAWRVLHANGVDGVRGTWLSKWDLWGIFLLLIIVAATRKLISLKVSALALVTLLLGYHEPGMPTGFLAFLLLLLPLTQVTTGRIKRSVDVAVVLGCVGLILALVGFAINNFRLAIYPSLERNAVGVYQAQDSSMSSALYDVAEDFVAQREEMTAGAAKAMRAPIETAQPSPAKQQDAYLLGENDLVQTGPGAPSWLWNTVRLTASSPVPAAAEITLWYSPPWATRVWQALAALLAIAYGGLLMQATLRNFRRDDDPQAEADSGSTAAPGTAATQASLLLIGAAGLVVAALPQNTNASEYPPAHLLKQLEQRLTAPPACSPHCLSLDQGVIQTSKNSLTIGFSAFAATEMLLPLPTPREGWQVTDIFIDGVPQIAAKLHNGHLAVALPQGHHIVSVTGKLNGDMASVSLPASIHNMVASSDHWQLSGLVEGRVPSGTLSLRALTATGAADRDTLTPDPVTPYFNVHREFYLSTQWRVVTRVTRLAPLSGPVSVTIPLLAFEQPLSADINFRDAKARLQFGDRQRTITWESSMQPVDNLELVAADGEDYVETWRFLPSALWRLDHEGIPPVRAASGIGSMQPQWQPWPGESLALQFARPEGVAGPTFTIEQASLNYQDGSSVRQSTLMLTIKASIGQDFSFELPTDARITSLNREGKELSLPNDHRVDVTLQPGVQHVAVEFEQDGAAGWLSTTPSVNLPGGASNITLTYNLPQDRWPLYLTGPDIGPAMLYWGVFCVILLGAVILSLLGKKLTTALPIGLVGWLLLGVGLSTVNSYGVLVVAVFFFALAYRYGVDPNATTRTRFNLLQVALVLWTVITLLTLVSAIPLGLLSSPNMLVTGNNSWSHLYNFFQDRAPSGNFPTATVVSVNLLVYRAVMLVWSLWLASRLIRWVAWAWNAFRKEGVWRAKQEAGSS